MKHLDEYRDAATVRRLAKAIAATATRPWTLMEVCGGQTHAIVRFGLDELLPPTVELIHGPGCPVCVTPTRLIDHAITLARRPGLMLCSYGDMLRVPGTMGDLFLAKSEGGERLVFAGAHDGADVPGSEETFDPIVCSPHQRFDARGNEDM